MAPSADASPIDIAPAVAIETTKETISTVRARQAARPYDEQHKLVCIGNCALPVVASLKAHRDSNVHSWLQCMHRRHARAGAEAGTPECSQGVFTVHNQATWRLFTISSGRRAVQSAFWWHPTSLQVEPCTGCVRQARSFQAPLGGSSEPLHAGAILIGPPAPHLGHPAAASVLAGRLARTGSCVAATCPRTEATIMSTLCAPSLHACATYIAMHDATSSRMRMHATRDQLDLTSSSAPDGDRPDIRCVLQDRLLLCGYIRGESCHHRRFHCRDACSEEGGQVCPARARQI